MKLNTDEIMGKRRIIDKSIQPMSTIQNITPANFTIARQTPAYGAIVMGDYRGAARFLDLDKMVVQPLVVAEQQYIMGILDGREEGYDIVTVSVPVTAVATTLLSGALTVPAGELWYVNCVRMNCPGDVAGGAGFTLNWHCNLWTDRVGASAYGQPFRTAAVALASVDPSGAIFTHVVPAGGAIQQLDEFGDIATAWSMVNKIPMLRLPANTVITFTVLSDTGLVAVATASTLSVHGAMAKILVT